MLADADTIVIIADGRDGDNGREAPHIATPQRVALVDALIRQGCGIVVIHFSTFAPDAVSQYVLDWYGGYFDWETDGRREWYSDITTTEAQVMPASPKHAILSGVSPFKLHEEYYYDIRFRHDDAGWTPIWTVDALPATKPKGNVVAWAIERDDGHRAFATTCGHFHDNWKQHDFRKSILNAIAWTAHVEIPAGGVQSTFHTRSEIAAHLGEADLLESTDPDQDVYKDEPYWYKPGHPVNPAEASAIQTLPGFTVDKVLAVPEEYGSWTAITVDAKGRLICAAQHGPGLYRITPPALDASPAAAKVERLAHAAQSVGWSHGLLYAFDSLYVTVTEQNDEAVEAGVYRLRDTDGDDQFDDVEQLFQLNPSGEHGPHNIVRGPDGESLYMICGNGTKLPSNIIRRHPSSSEGIDHLMPPGFESSKYATEGFVLRFDSDGNRRELLCSGLRNSFDLAFNQAGDLFTFDSDMEWDLGAPWYRPTRICHLIGGGEFGWRGDAAIWPEYYEDSVAPVVNIGPASPTGLVFGYGARFPAKYQHALFACDWTFATIHAVHLEPTGATYRATIEEFVAGRGLPVTDLVIGKDGGMYFLVGGRRLGSALYRVRYSGAESTAPIIAPALEGTDRALNGVRRDLEAYHGVRDDKAIATAWPYLGHDDRAIRFAARVAIESQPVQLWRQRALRESDMDARLNGLLALARQDAADRQGDVLRELNSLVGASFSVEELLRLLRVYELALARGESNVVRLRETVRQSLHSLFPQKDPRANRELARLLCYLGDASMIDSLLQRMATDPGEQPVLGSGYFVRNKKYGKAIQDILEAAPLVDRMHYAQMLLWLDDGWTHGQRAEYFRLIADAAASSKGGYWYVEFWERIREAALGRLPENLREDFKPVSAIVTAMQAGENLPLPKGPGRPWELSELLQVAQDKFADRDFDNGKKMFSAASCIVCHRFNGEGNSIGPDLSTLGQRFTTRDILDATLNPSKAVSDQYRVSMIATNTGRMITGRVVTRDANKVAIATNLRRPSQTTVVQVGEIEEEYLLPVSTMPTELLNPLNEDEILDLLAYLTSGGDERNPVFRK
jgi:putative heme-binding domain-containing protein